MRFIVLLGCWFFATTSLFVSLMPSTGSFAYTRSRVFCVSRSLFIARALADPISPRSLNYAGNYLISPGAPPRQGERRANFGNYRLTRFLIKAPDPFALAVRSTTLWYGPMCWSCWCENGFRHSWCYAMGFILYYIPPWCDSINWVRFLARNTLGLLNVFN
jgi:hypothetical protein